MSLNVGDIAEGIVGDIMDYGVFIRLEDGQKALVHISEVSNEYVQDIHSVLKRGDKVKVKVISITENGKLALSIKKAQINKPKKEFENKTVKSIGDAPSTLDDMLSKFLKDSDERQLDLRRNIESKRGASRKRA